MEHECTPKSSFTVWGCVEERADHKHRQAFTTPATQPSASKPRNTTKINTHLRMAHLRTDGFSIAQMVKGVKQGADFAQRRSGRIMTPCL